jgi:hypothetical protein
VGKGALHRLTGCAAVFLLTFFFFFFFIFIFIFIFILKALSEAFFDPTLCEFPYSTWETTTATVQITSENEEQLVVVSPKSGTLTFSHSNWRKPQFVKLRAPRDWIDRGAGVVVGVRHTASSLDSAFDATAARFRVGASDAIHTGSAMQSIHIVNVDRAQIVLSSSGGGSGSSDGETVIDVWDSIEHLPFLPEEIDEGDSTLGAANGSDFVFGNQSFGVANESSKVAQRNTTHDGSGNTVSEPNSFSRQLYVYLIIMISFLSLRCGVAVRAPPLACGSTQNHSLK